MGVLGALQGLKARRPPTEIVPPRTFGALATPQAFVHEVIVAVDQPRQQPETPP
jgi:hypothetical protein